MRLLWAAGASLFLLAALPLTSSAQLNFAEFPVPTAGAGPSGITVGSDNAIWFAEYEADAIGRIDINGNFTSYSLESTSGTCTASTPCRPQQIVSGPDGNLYFTVANGNFIGQLVPSTGVISQFPIPTANASPTGITVGHDGNIWFTEAAPGVNAIAAVSTTGSFAVVTPIAITTANSIPTWLTVGPDDNIWFTEQCPASAGCSGGGKIGTVAAGVIHEYAVGAGSGPFAIVSGPDGNLWFTDRSLGMVDRITTGGTITTHSLASASTQPLGITVGPDGALWFAEVGTNQIGRITTGGARTDYAIPTPNSNPYAIIEGPDNALWFSEGVANKIGRISEIAFESLQQVPGALTQVSIGADGSVWGINQFQQTYTYNTATGSWTEIAGTLKTISAGNTNAVWGLNYANQIYHYDAATKAWVNVPGELNQIAVGGDGSVWGINYLGNIYFYNGSGWSQVTGTLSTNPGSIAVGSAGAVYGLNSNGGIYWYNPGTGLFQWLKGTVGFTQIAVGIDGDLWGIQNGTVYHYDVLHGTGVATGSYTQVVVGSGASVFALNASGDVFQWDATSQAWVQIPGILSDISVGANGTVWGVNSSQQIYRLLGAPTRPYQALSIIQGATLDQISVGVDGAVWGVSGGTVEFFNRGTQTFQAVPGAPTMAQVSVAAGNDVWGVDLSGNIYEYVAGTSPAWTHIPGELNLVQVNTGPLPYGSSVWGINASGETYYYDFATSSWVQIPGNLGTLSVGVDGTVWGINGQLQVYRYSGSTNGSVGTWTNIPGSLSEISVGSANNVWGINAQNDVYYYNNGWVQIPGALLNEVWTTFDGAVWGVNANGGLYQWKGSSFSQVGTGTTVSYAVAGNATNVWAVNATNGSVYMWF